MSHKLNSASVGAYISVVSESVSQLNTTNTTRTFGRQFICCTWILNNNLPAFDLLHNILVRVCVTV